MSTTFSLDEAGRRLTQSTAGGWDDGMVVTRHYTDTSDNPSWSVTAKPGQAESWTKYTPGLDGGLGAMIAQDGSASISLVDPHDNNVTAITIPASSSSTTTAFGITGWSGYDEYGGLPINWHWADSSVTGPLGYGWLGGKERATNGQTAQFTLMGARLYNWTTGGFTSPDPVPGGNDTSYGYPTDPINSSDPTGQFGWPRWVKKAANWVKKNPTKAIGLAAFGTCSFVTLGTCAAVGVVASVANARISAGRFRSWGFARSLGVNLAWTAGGYGAGRLLQSGYQMTRGAAYSSYKVRRAVPRSVGQIVRPNYRRVPNWKYRSSYYVHSTKLSVMQSYFSDYM
ncbi:hypothetical protein [Branchiibius hedensis]|nr:hypothetical protein [Branchiibius hedensis]